MGNGLLVASLGRAGGHIALLGIVVLIGAVVGLVYGLVHGRRSDRGHAGERGPAA